MMSLSDEAKKFFKSIGKADIIIGIPSYNNAKTIAFVIEQAVKGIYESYPSAKAVIFNSDGSSTDGTPEIVKRTAERYDLDIVSYPYTGKAGKGSSIKAIIEASEITNASATVLLDSDLRSIKPFWVSSFLKAIIEDGYDYITPFYIRHRYDGTITNNIVYPLLAGVYGKDIRQPIGGDFGMSGKTSKMLLEELNKESSEEVFEFGIDIFLTINAVVGKCRIAQLRLGTKIHDPKDPATSLTPMFFQVTKTLFELIIKHTDFWKDIKELKKAEIIGVEINEKPEEVKINKEALFNRWQEGLSKYKWIYNAVLAKESSAGLYGAGISSEAWANIIYDFIPFYKKAKDKNLVINALLPLYFGRTLGIITETEGLSDDTVENIIHKQAEIFWHTRERLLTKI